MSDTFDENGLQLQTLAELRAGLESDFRSIYGDDINIDQNSPDGQIINIFAQQAADLREVLAQINSGFDPDEAFGRVLDQRIAYNSITRNSGTFTFTPVSITTDRALNLVGLDDQATELSPTVPNLYTIRDSAGNQFFLVSSVSITMAGTQALSFRAANIGQVEVQLNTITIPVTVIAGVTSINNPDAPTIIGVNEESDASVKIRRRASVSIPSLGFLDSMQASLADLDGVTTALVLENNTNVTDGDGTPAHTIWVIVEGGADAAIGNIIYVKKSAGAGMRGTQTVSIPRPQGGAFVARFDRPGEENLWIRFSLSLIGGGVIDLDEVRRQIVEGLFWDIGGDAGADDVIEFIKGLDDNYRVTGAELSTDNVTFAEVVSVASPQNRFVNDISRIIIA